MLSQLDTCFISIEQLDICVDIDISRIRTAIKLMQSTWTLVSNNKAEHAVELKWDWSCMSDLPSKGTLSGHTTICDIVT